MDQTFDRSQRRISHLEIQGKVITQEDMNLKLLRSLPSEWKTHALIWRNKEEIETISLMRVPRKDNIYSVDLKSVIPTKEKQYKASCKAKPVNSISKPLHMLHMDLFGVTNVKSLMKKPSNEKENQQTTKTKLSEVEMGTEFKNSVMNQFCEMKGIKREFSIARTPQQNGVAKRRNRKLNRAARTIIFDNAYDDEDVGANVDLNNLETTTNVSPIPTTRIDKDHTKDQIIGDFNSAIQTRRMNKIFNEHAMMYVKSAFLYGTIEEEVYVCQPPSFEDPHFPDKVYKVEKALYGLHQAPRAWYETLSTYLIENGFKRGIIDKTLFIKKDKGDILLVPVYADDIIFGSTKKSLCDEFKGLQVQQKEDGIFISQDKYVAEILKKFDFATVKTTSTPIETNKALVKDEEAEAIQSFYMELWSDKIAGASLDRKSTTGGCQFLRRRLISWQCKKQTIVANSTTEAEYVAAANCCGQVLWIQNQMLDYGFNFMNTKIYIDNESTICIVKNLVFHSKTKNIEIRHHFIRDSYEKKLIQVIKIHTDHNVADLLTKAFDVSSLSEPIHLVANETAYKEWEDRMERAATTASSLEAKQDIEKKIEFSVFGFIEDVITKTIDYHLFDVVVEFHREIHDLNFRGSSCKNLFVLSSSNRGRLLGFTDLMRQKNKRMKQEGLIQHYGILEDLKSNSSYLLI
ncbi:putative ribonuclease H-like domain-containing protein [Tanacetum coccineum]